MGKIRIKQVGAGLEELERKKSGTPPEADGSALQKKARERAAAPARLRSRRPRDRSARYKKAQQQCAAFGKVQGASLKDAVKLARKTATAKFPETIEAHINVAKTGLRATVILPYATGKKRSLLIFVAEETAKLSDKIRRLALKTINVKVAGPEEIERIKTSGSAPNVDEIWATPDTMKTIATVARILGPAGLMPNPKKNTIVKDTAEIEAKLKRLDKGATTIETERKAPVIHATLGKAGMDESHLAANLEAILAALPPKEIKKVTLSSTMGPGVRLSLAPLSMV